MLPVSKLVPLFVAYAGFRAR